MFLRNKKVGGALVVLMLAWQNAQTQDIHFSQFFEANLWRNPSLAGLFEGDLRVQATFRDQWQSVTDAYKTGAFDAEYKMPIGKGNDFITTGLQVVVDKAGTIGWTSAHVLPVVNYHKSMSNYRNSYLSVGFMGGWVNQHFDRSKMTTNSQYDGLGDGENFPATSINYMNGAVGISYNSVLGSNPKDNYYIGAALHNFNRPNKSFYNDQKIQVLPKWVFSGGIHLIVTDQAYLTFQGDYLQQANYKSLIIGGMYGLNIGDDVDAPKYTIHGGAFLRWNDAIIPVLKLDYRPFSVTISYDVNISNLKRSTRGRGGAEISLSYRGFLNRDKADNYLLCPKF